MALRDRRRPHPLLVGVRSEVEGRQATLLMLVAMPLIAVYETRKRRRVG
jgi:hypothetical protein